jgi:8-oxo-dGTP pyrophosphatase MutT (NUDIX family)
MDDALRRLSAALTPPAELPPAPAVPAFPAAVLIPLFTLRRTRHVLFTRRTETVEYHRGQVSFPGGRLEAGDGDAIHAALRETEEEIGLRPADVRVLGSMPPLLTITNFWVTPVVGLMPWPYAFQLNPDEVAAVFGIPLDWLADPSHRETREWDDPQTGARRAAVFFQPYQGEIVWGVTAQITVDLLNLLQVV